MSVWKPTWNEVMNVILPPRDGVAPQYTSPRNHAPTVKYGGHRTIRTSAFANLSSQRSSLHGKLDLNPGKGDLSQKLVDVDREHMDPEPSVFTCRESERPRALNRVNRAFARKSAAMNWLLAATLAAAALCCRASYAAQKTIEWLDEIQCSNSIRFDPKKYDEQRLRNTVAVIFANRFTGNPFPDIPADIPVHPASPASVRLEQYQQLCEGAIRQAAELAVIDLPGIEAYRKLKLEALNDSCQFEAIKIRAAAGDPSALRSFTPSVEKCSPFIDALEGKTDLMETWRGLHLLNCQSPDEAKANPAACRVYPELGKVEDTEHVRYDVLGYGWNNCSTPYLRGNVDRKYLEEMQAALVREFARRFKIKRPPCSE
jgi:hypothetical protein